MALSISPSAFLLGADGNWTAFPVHIGDGDQWVNLFVSTSQSIDYVVLFQGCANFGDSCSSDRGGIYYPGGSTTWQFAGPTPVTSNYHSSLLPNLYNPTPLAQFGSDTVALGYAGYGGSSIGTHLIGGISDLRFYIGVLGIFPKSFTLGNATGDLAGPQTSFMQSLKDSERIASLSWGYTAGAPYQLDGNGPKGSLTLGGYDRNRFASEGLSFAMNEDFHKYLTVGVQSIRVTAASGRQTNILTDGIFATLDSTLPYLWLPRDVCDKFEAEFGLLYDSDAELYYVPPRMRSRFIRQNTMPSVEFTLGSRLSGGESMKIILPYLSFDMIIEPPLVPVAHYYFPIKRAANSTQFTLGRAFFQEAYIIADFENQNFSVSQARFYEGYQSNIIEIKAPKNSTVTVTKQDDSGSSTPEGLIAGVVVAVVLILLLVGGGIWFWRRRKRRAAERDDRAPPYSEQVAELDGNSRHRPEKTKNELEAIESGRATPVGYESGRATPVGYERKSPGRPGASPLSSPRSWGSHSPPADGSPMGEMDGNTYFELPGSMAALARGGSGARGRMQQSRGSSPSPVLGASVVSPVSQGHPSPPAEEMSNPLSQVQLPPPIVGPNPSSSPQT